MNLTIDLTYNRGSITSPTMVSNNRTQFVGILKVTANVRDVTEVLKDSIVFVVLLINLCLEGYKILYSL